MSAVDGIVYSTAFGNLVLSPIAGWGYRRHLVGDDTPEAAYRAMRKLYGTASTRPWERLVERAQREQPPLALSAEPAGVAAGSIGDLVASLERDGLARLPNLLDPAICDELEAVAAGASCRLTEPIGTTAPDRAVFDRSAPVAVRYDLDEADALSSPAAQRLVADESLLAVAQAYLGAAPVQDLVAMWWSAAGGGPASDAAAQQFHFDLDRVRFLKFFVYLTDVDEQHGPHVYVRGSHRAKPSHLRRDGRHADAEVEVAFAGATELITGPRGSMFLADTIGMHKGLPLETGHRLVFQTEWSTSLFGAPFTRPVVREPDPVLVDAARRHPRTFRRFDLGTPT